MTSLSKLEQEKRFALRGLSSQEKKSYMKSLIDNLYTGFMEQDPKKTLNSRELIEETTDEFVRMGYSNSHEIELSLRLQKANELLVKTLEEKDELQMELSKRIVEDYHDRLICDSMFCNTILEHLTSCECNPSNSVRWVEPLLVLLENHIYSSKIFLENYEGYDKESYEIIKSEIDKFKVLKSELQTLKL